VETLSLYEFLKTDYKNVLLMKLTVPVDGRKTRFCKAAARGMNSHSLLNAGFSSKSDGTAKALKILVDEIVVEPEKAYNGNKLDYRKSLVPSFFYKYFLSLLGDSIPSNLKSAAAVMYTERPLSKVFLSLSLSLSPHTHTNTHTHP